MGPVKDLLDPETGERIGTNVVPETAAKVPEKKRRWPFPTVSQIYGALWPTTWEHLLAALILCTLLMAVDDSKLNHISHYLWVFSELVYLDSKFPRIVRILATSFLVAVVYFITLAVLRQYLLKLLLSYKGWLYQPPKSQSKVVMLWGLLVKFVSGRNPRLYSYQNCMPRMPVPPLKTTVKKLLESLKPVLDKEEFTTMEKEAQQFLKNCGYFPQWLLQFKSWWAPNYHTDWWEKYVYLMSRSPLPICSNYYILDYVAWNPTKKQAARAATYTTFVVNFKEKLDAEELEPFVIRDTIPLCMWQYKRMFCTTRIPGKEIDEYKHTPHSQHFAVSAKGLFYKLSVVDAHGKRLNALDLQDQFEWIIKDAEERSKRKTEAESHIAALTGSERTQWADIRSKYFSSGVNKESLKVIEEAISVIVFDDKEFPDVTERCKQAMHGSGSSMWFDKSFSCVIFKDGKLGLNFEHGWADAPVPGHLAEFAQAAESNYRTYDQNGDIKPFWTGLPGDREKYNRSSALIIPTRLEWDIEEQLENFILGARLFSIKNNSDLDLCMDVHEAFGKGFIKTTGNSPDAFLQMAFQLAYYKDSGGRFALTYEATVTRLFLNGRTETVRSLTQEVQEFVLAMNDKSVTTKEKTRLMRIAAGKHQKNYRDCMNGKGIDRHLFALYVVCKAKGYDTSFLSKAFAMPWTLSTSCTPVNTLQHGLFHHVPEAADMVSPGGGFGPVSDTGYGIAYSLPNEDMVQLHISSKHSCPETNSRRMTDNVFWAMSKMKTIFDEVSQS